MTHQGNTFDPVKHQYTIGGAPVNGVTQALDASIGVTWRASDWHLDRGKAVHACCALVALGKQFTVDPQIEGQVSACRKWFADIQPVVISVEHILYHELYRFAGCTDLVCEIGGRTCIIDWKASHGPLAFVQEGGYSLLTGVNWGAVVDLHEDGTYKMSKVENLKRYANEFLACLTVAHVKERCGIKKETTE